MEEKEILFKNNEIVFHYHLTDGLHQIDAKIHNDAEKEILGLIYDVFEVLKIDADISLVLETEGGWRDIFKVCIKGITTLGALSGLIYPIIVSTITSNPELENEQIENLRAQTELIKIQTKQIKEKEIKDKGEQTKEIIVINNIYNNCADLNLSENIAKREKRQSNLYNNINKDVSISAFSIETSSNNTFTEISKVERSNFQSFIKETHDERTIDENATIEIVSPVLNNNGRIKWKGIYNDSLIDFSMKDKEFREKILKKEIRFESENVMSVVLEIKRKVNDDGDEDSVSYAVTEVLGTEYKDGGYFETKKGTKRREDANQLSLFEKFDVDIKK